MLRIGLTGGIGAGKSVVSKKFNALYDIPVIDADDLTRDLMQIDKEAYHEIVAVFGMEALTDNKEINRKFLRDVIFSDRTKRAILEKIIHPKVEHAITEKVANLSSAYCLIVIPLLIESNMQSVVDRILVVDTRKQNQLERVVNRDGCDTDQVQKIIDAQIDPDERLRHADDIITNNGDLGDLDQQIHRLHQKYLALSRSPFHNQAPNP